MTRKQETLADKVMLVYRQISGSARRVEMELARLEELEQHLPKTVEIRSLFRLHINSIRQEMQNLTPSQTEGE